VTPVTFELGCIALGSMVRITTRRCGLRLWISLWISCVERSTATGENLLVGVLQAGGKSSFGAAEVFPRCFKCVAHVTRSVTRSSAANSTADLRTAICGTDEIGSRSNA